VSYNYTTPDEYHLDRHKAFCDFMSANNKQYGGFRLRVGEHPLLLVGQDKSTFHQFVFSKKQWKGPNGKASPMWKSEGEIYMASGYMAREFGLGLGMQLLPAKCNKIKESH
jgi:hypothetical protein